MDYDRRALLRGAGAAGFLWNAPLRATASPAKLPIEAFADRPPMDGLQLSPDGTMVLARMQVRGTELIGTYVIHSGQFKTYPLPPGSDLRWYRWAGSGRILVSILRKVEQRENYMGNLGTIFEWGRVSRLLSFDVATGTATFVGLKEEGPEGDNVIFVDPDGAYVLMSQRLSAVSGPRVYRIDLATGAAAIVIPDTAGIVQWYTDEKGVVRAGFGWRDRKWFVTYRSDRTKPFVQIETGDYHLFEHATFNHMTFVSGSDQGYVASSEGTGRDAVYAYDFAAHKRGERLCASDTNDVNEPIFDPRSNKLQGYRFIDDRPRVVWIDPLLKEIQAGIDRGLPDRLNRIVDHSDDGETFLIRSETSADRGRYYIFHLSNSKLTQLLDLTGKLRPEEMATMQPVSYRARDGLLIPAYLTLPVGREPRNLPLVIMPHGGPYGIRDVWGFDLQVQFLANRGYAVLQPNNRGSDSYGADFLNAGRGEWGRKMQDDLDDGMDWLAGRGVIDSKRACLVGGSYGGYAAAWGATRSPERYRCAACYAGVFDLRAQIGYAPELFAGKNETEFLDYVRGTGGFSLDAVSPLKTVNQLKVPVLLVHGDDDPVVPIQQSRNYDSALKKAGKPHEFYTIANEVHGFTQKTSFAFYLTKLDAFLTAHNPA